MTRKTLIILLFILTWLLIGCASGATSNTPRLVGNTVLNNPTGTPASSPTSPTNTPTTTNTPTVPPAQPTIIPTSPPTRPTPTPTTPKPTPTPSPSYHTCTFASCANPWGYSLKNGADAPLVTSAPAGFCSWFLCASDFVSNAGGDIVACNDNTFDWTGYAGDRCENDSGIRGWLTP